MQKETQALIHTINNNYFTPISLYSKTDRVVAKLCPKIGSTEGKKYIRISLSGSAWTGA
jgi:hypothetical protein